MAIGVRMRGPKKRAPGEIVPRVRHEERVRRKARAKLVHTKFVIGGLDVYEHGGQVRVEAHYLYPDQAEALGEKLMELAREARKNGGEDSTVEDNNGD